MAWQTGMNSSSRCASVRRWSSQYFGDRHALDQLHDEVGPARLGAAGVEHAGDVRVVHQRQRLPLRLEPRHDLGGIEPGLDDLESNGAANRLELLGHPDGAHASFADRLQELVGPDPCPRGFGGRRRLGRGGRRADYFSTVALKSAIACSRTLPLQHLRQLRTLRTAWIVHVACVEALPQSTKFEPINVG